MTSWSTPAAPAQLAHLHDLAAQLDEEVPAGLRAFEAAQRIDEFRRHLTGGGHVVNLRGETRPIETVRSVLL